MAKQLIPEELDLLIQEYLTDGVLTDKERAVILRKAEGMGLDRDEIDLYLDAQVQKIDQATDAAARRQKGKQCPYCGGSVPLLSDKCPHCGQFITPEASADLQDILDNLEEALVNMKSEKDFDRSKALVEKNIRKAKMFYSNHPKIKQLLVEIDSEMAIAEKRIKANNFKRKSKWYWSAIPFGVGVIMMIINEIGGHSYDRIGDIGGILFYLGVFVFIITLFFSFISYVKSFIK